jgi:DNA repair protein RadC
MNTLTSAACSGYANRTVPHWTGGFGSPKIPGAEVMRRQAHGFFYALRFMAGGVLGGCEACRTQGPVYQPSTSSAAQSLVALVGGLKPQPLEPVMNKQTQVAPAVHAAKARKVPHFISDSSGKYVARRALTDQQIIKAAKAILDNAFSPGAAITSPYSLKLWLQLNYQDLEHEVFSCVFMDNQHHIIAHDQLFKGTFNQTTVYPREVVKRALQLNAGAVIFVHNHPSGIVKPSTGDKATTIELKEALNLFGVRTLDHIVVGKEGAFSFSEHNLI